MANTLRDLNARDRWIKLFFRSFLYCRIITGNPIIEGKQMSFKQTKHWDSEVMRSLEKVAYEKGLIKPEPLQKQASLSKTADITPTSDLMQNIIKLCIALRAEGLVKEAAEVETNFFNYKKAQTLYEVTKEKGEDLVDAAHPQGSHKLEGLDSEEAVVEDIVDRHNKMKAVVDKKPTGKYSSSKIY